MPASFVTFHLIVSEKEGVTKNPAVNFLTAGFQDFLLFSGMTFQGVPHIITSLFDFRRVNNSAKIILFVVLESEKSLGELRE